MTATVSIDDAKTYLPRLIARVEKGEEITITRHGRPVARLASLDLSKAHRTPGVWHWRVRVADDFDALSESELLEWYGA